MMFFRVFVALLLAVFAEAGYINPALTLPPTPVLPLKGATTGFVNTADQVNIWYAQFGQSLSKSLSQGKSPVIFIHGGYANSNYFGLQVDALLLSGYAWQNTIITLDSRAQGRSSGLGQPISYDLIRQDVVKVMDHFNIPKAQIVGWSDGGIIALNMAINVPNRLSRAFAFAGQYNYTNINSTAGDSYTFSAYLNRTQLEYAQLAPNSNWTALDTELEDTFSTMPNYTESDLAKIPTLSQDCKNNPLFWVVDAADEEVINLDTPRTLHEWIPDSGLLILPSVSHFAFIQDPETFSAAVLRFLTYKVQCS